MTWDLKRLLLSPRGRINRAKYWSALVATYVVFFVFYVPVTSTLGSDRSESALQIFFVILTAVLAILIAYIGTILGIKRFHDRNKSGWWVLIGMVPFIGGLWYLIECGCLRGTIGRNRFGPDPLAPNEDIVQVFDAPARTPIN